MKFQKMFRMQMMLVGLAAAFFFAGTVRAQEITNTEFNDGPNVVSLAQPAAADQATYALPSSQAIQASESVAAASAAPQQASVTVPSPSAWVTFLLTLGVGLLALYTLIAADRASRNLGSYVSARSA